MPVTASAVAEALKAKLVESKAQSNGERDPLKPGTPSSDAHDPNAPAQTADAATDTEPSAQTDAASPTPGAPRTNDDQHDFLRDSEDDSQEDRARKANMRAGFDRKMSELDRVKKDLEAKSAASQQHAEKAQLLDRLLASKDPAKALDAIRGLQGASADQAAQASQPWFSPRQFTDPLKKIGLPDQVAPLIEDAFDLLFEQKFGPILRPYADYIADDARTKQQAKLGSLRDRFEVDDATLSKALQAERSGLMTAEQALAGMTGKVAGKNGAQNGTRTNGVHPAEPKTADIAPSRPKSGVVPTAERARQEYVDAFFMQRGLRRTQ